MGSAAAELTVGRERYFGAGHLSPFADRVSAPLVGGCGFWKVKERYEFCSLSIFSKELVSAERFVVEKEKN